MKTEYLFGIDVGTSDVSVPVAMFTYTCSCGAGIIQKCPEEIGGVIRYTCVCGIKWRLEWMGDRFQTTNENATVIEGERVEWGGDASALDAERTGTRFLLGEAGEPESGSECVVEGEVRVAEDEEPFETEGKGTHTAI